MKTSASPPPWAPFLLTVILLAGCRTTRVDSRLSAYGSLNLPPAARGIGVTFTHPMPEFALNPPLNRQEAARSLATAGAREAAGSEAAFAFPAVLVLGGLIGGVIGVSEEELHRSATTILAAVRDLPIETRLRQALRAHVATSHPATLRELADNVPLEPGVAPGRLRKDAGRLVWERPMTAAHPLAGTDIDVVVGMRVSDYGLKVRANPRVHSTGDAHLDNAPLAVVLVIHVNAVRVRDWADLGGMTLCYESRPHRFTEWSADQAQLLRRELEIGLQEILRAFTPALPPPPAGFTRAGRHPAEVMLRRPDPFCRKNPLK